MEEEEKKEFLKSWSHPFLTNGCDKNSAFCNSETWYRYRYVSPSIGMTNISGGENIGIGNDIFLSHPFVKNGCDHDFKTFLLLLLFHQTNF